MKKANLIVIGAVIIGLGIGTAIGLQQIKSSEPTIASPEETQENSIEEQKAAIREFRGEPNLELEYVKTKSHATQFGIAKEVKGENTYYYETPDEYKYPVAVYQEKEMIGGGCEVFEYEVDVETNEIVEVRIIYPGSYYGMEKEMTREELNQKCQKTHEFLETPSLANLEEIAIDFLKKHAEKTWVRMNDFEEFKSQLIYSSKGNNHWWKWVDKNYQYYSLPEGFEITGIPPTVQVGISSGGYLINYHNNTSYFELAMQAHDQK